MIWLMLCESLLPTTTWQRGFSSRCKLLRWGMCKQHKTHTDQGQKYFNILSKAVRYLDMSKICSSRQFSLSLLNVFVVLEFSVIATTITLIMSSDVTTVISDCLSQLVETVVMDFGWFLWTILLSEIVYTQNKRYFLMSFRSHMLWAQSHVTIYGMCVTPWTKPAWVEEL